jgi:fatty-acyl-CoA synthase
VPRRAGVWICERALAGARDLGGSIVAAVPDEGRIEASDRTFWFGCTDDVVIRIRGHESGSLIDIRSASRVEVSDLGVNAARIQAFTEKLVDGSVVR